MKKAKSEKASSGIATELLVGALMDLVVEMVEAKCSKLNTRDRGTLKRRIQKAVESFVKDREK